MVSSRTSNIYDNQRFDIKNFRQHLIDAGIAILGEQISGSQIILPYGNQIRRRLYHIGAQLVKKLGFAEVVLSDLVPHEKLQLIDAVSPVLGNYPLVNDGKYHMAAGHEISAYLFAKSYFQHFPHTKLPFNFFHFGSVYRHPRNTKFPFNYGERKSFFECYSIHNSTQEARDFFTIGTEWNRKFICEILKLPAIEVERPLLTNRKMSRKTSCIDTLTPLGRTVITGMTYHHDDIFTRPLQVKLKDPITGKKRLTYSTHFGVSDNIFFSYLLNSYDDHGFRLLSRLAPYQVSINYDNRLSNQNKFLKNLITFLEIKKIRYITKLTPSKQMKREFIKNRLQGIPVSIDLTNTTSKATVATFAIRTENTAKQFSSIEIIEKLILKNDQDIYSSFKNKEESNVVFSSSLLEIKECVSSGKVAKIFLENSDENVKKIELTLKGGEVLGFQANSTERGIDILNGRSTSSLAFVSRRI